MTLKFHSIFSNESKTDQDSYEDIIKLVENIRLGKAAINQQLAVISRCTSLIRKIREESDEHLLTEVAFVLQACRGEDLTGFCRQKIRHIPDLICLFGLYQVGSLYQISYRL